MKIIKHALNSPCKLYYSVFGLFTNIPTLTTVESSM